MSALGSLADIDWPEPARFRYGPRSGHYIGPEARARQAGAFAGLNAR
jgi:hypothetical protein